jgi:hypothetical protein
VVHAYRVQLFLVVQAFPPASAILVTCANLADCCVIPLDRALGADYFATHSGRSTQAMLSLGALSLSASLIIGRCDIETTCLVALRARRRCDD